MKHFLTRRQFAKAVVGTLAAAPMLSASGLWFSTAHAQSATGGWSLTGSLNTARDRHTATLLKNGRVLVTGGDTVDINDHAVPLATSEVYDPATTTWTPTGQMNTPRLGHISILLQNGQVLVAGGGRATSVFLASAELYNPATGSWTLTGPMHTARADFVATLLPSGQVLVAGGDGTGGNALASAELYNPATGSWTLTSSMHTARAKFTATMLSNGQVLVAGGQGSDGILLASAELYNPATGSWTLTGSMHDARMDFTATIVSGGQVLVAGGGGTIGILASAELYDPATGSWTPTGSMHDARLGHTATTLSGRQILVAGGFGTTSVFLASAELYDPATGSWTPAVSMHDGRMDFTATLLPSGQVLAAGGQGAGNDLASAELFAPDPDNPPTGNPHVVAVDTAGVLWRTLRHLSGTWAGAFVNVNQQELNGARLQFRSASCATDSAGNLHVISVDSGAGVLWHTIHYPNGTWVGAFGNVNQQELNGARLQFRSASCATDSMDNLHVIAVDSGAGVLWHTIRYPNGTWVGAFGNVNQQELNGANLQFNNASCATDSAGNLHVVSVDSGAGVLWHTIRHADGTWVGAFGNVNQQELNGANLQFNNASCATDSMDNLHVIAVDSGAGVLWHTIRHADGTWIGAFSNVNQQELNGANLPFRSASCTTDNTGNLHIVAADSGAGVLWHTIRHADGTWVGAFGNVNQQESNGASLQFQTVGIA